MRHISGIEAKLFCFGFLLCLIARGSSLFTATFNVDDLWYWPINFDFSNVGIIAFREGRFFGPILAALYTFLGVNASHAFTLSGVTLMASQCVTALLLCRLWKIDQDWRLSAIAVSVLVLHPYQADISTWKIAQLNGGLPFVMTFGALVVCTRGIGWFTASIGLIILALGIHQIPLEMASAALVLAVPISIARANFDRAVWVVRVGALSTATILYVLAAQIAIDLLPHGETLGRDKLILISDPLIVLSRCYALVVELSLNDPLTGWLTRILLAALFVIGAFGISKRLPLSPLQRTYCLTALITGTCVAFLCAISLTIVPRAWMPAFRNLSSVGVVWAATAVLAFGVSSGLFRKGVVFAITLILIGFTGSNNEVLSDQQRANVRDLSMMNRIASRIAGLENFRDIRRLAFVGTTGITLSNLHTHADLSDGWHAYGTTLSVFAVPWPGYLVQLYNEMTGEQLGYPTVPAEQLSIDEKCVGQYWPSRGSVISSDDLAIICLGDPTRIAMMPLDR